MHQLPSFDYYPLLDKKFREGERGPELFDCYGLVMKCYELDWGVTVANYPNRGNPSSNRVEADAAALKHWKRLTRPQARCAVTFKLKDRFGNDNFHVGYMLTKIDFIHIIEGRHSAVESVLSPLWKSSIEAFFQWSLL